jgi:GNAT superfamily N-acetyltransferase
MSWMLPDNGSRLKSLTRTFAPLARHHFLPRTASEVGLRDGTIGAATLWDPPGQRKDSRLTKLMMMPAMMWAFRSRVPASQRVMELMEEHHPEEPHWYLMVIGSDPSVRGEGFGHSLMRSRLDRCDAEGAPAYLENSNPKNEPYYLRFGFEVMGEIKLPDGGPTMWPMWRAPR